MIGSGMWGREWETLNHRWRTIPLPIIPLPIIPLPIIPLPKTLCVSRIGTELHITDGEIGE